MRYMKIISVNPEYEPDKEVHKCLKNIPDFSNVKELIVEHVRQYGSDSAKMLQIMAIERRLQTGLAPTTKAKLKTKLKKLKNELV